MPLRPVDARRELTEAITEARVRDGELRAELAALAAARVVATDRLAATTADAAEARDLAKRALARASASARDGQRADAAKLTGAAQVFAIRLRDARAQVVALEAELAAGAERSRGLEEELATNVGHLRAVAAARVPVLTGRRAARAQQDVDEAVASIDRPVDDDVARGTTAGQVELARAAEAPAQLEVEPVSDDDLDSEVDLESADDVLDELRAEMESEASTDVADVPDDTPPDAAEDGAGPDPAGSTDPDPPGEADAATAATASTASTGEDATDPQAPIPAVRR
jgi:hypothetical protein